jgi:hypothetical protein
MILGKLCMETMRLESITRIIQPIHGAGSAGLRHRGHRLRLAAGEAELPVRGAAGAAAGRRAVHRRCAAPGRGGHRVGGRPLAAPQRRARPGGERAAGPGRDLVRVLRPPVAEDGAGRHHRHQRQDHHLLHGARDPGRRGPPARPDRHRALRDRQPRDPGHPHHAGGARHPVHAGPDGALRVPQRGHGGVVPRAAPEAHVRHRFRRGGLHQPDPRPPGLPPRHGAVFRRQDAALPRAGPACRNVPSRW